MCVCVCVKQKRLITLSFKKSLKSFFILFYHFIIIALPYFVYCRFVVKNFNGIYDSVFILKSFHSIMVQYKCFVSISLLVLVVVIFYKRSPNNSLLHVQHCDCLFLFKPILVLLITSLYMKVWFPHTINKPVSIRI